MRVWRACAGAATPPTTTTKGMSATPESSWRRCLDDSHFTVPADRAAVVGLYSGYVSALGGKIAEADAATYVQPDGIHFTRAGYRALGLRVAETLEEALIGRKAPPRTAIYPGLKKPPPAR